MFLMKAPAVLAVQSAWEAFGPPGRCRCPGRLPEPEGAGHAAVSARVQMLISSLRGDRGVQGRGQRGRGAPPAAACGLAVDIDPERKEVSAAFSAPLVLDSDSDDSVDRDIEEAIQEYLKAKSGAAQPAATHRDGPCQPELPPSGAPPTPCAPKLPPASGGGPGGGRLGAGEAPGSASPGSVSSEDSFEQSIRAEIEQFLSEKRQHETPKCAAPPDKRPDPDGSPARPALRSGKEPAGRAHRQDPAGPGKEFVFRKPPRLAQPRSLRSKVTAEPENAAGARPAAACRAADAQGRGGGRKSLGAGRRGPGVKSTSLPREASDSSSDDGIEEAIQRYQLEKRKEASGDPAPRAPPGEDQPDPTTHGAGNAAKSSLPETHRRTPGKKKPVAPKAVDLGPGGLNPDHPCRPAKESKVPAPAAGTAARSEAVGRAPCQADTSAELMCAEAILDISKTILPAPGEGGGRPPPTSPPPRPHSVPCRSDADSSSVDSDDSIEQEIRTFLALKAQSGNPPARAGTCPQPPHSPLPSPGPGGHAGGPRAPASKTLDLPLSCKRKRRGGGTATWAPAPKKTRDVASEGAPDAALGQGKASEASPGREGEARGQPVPCGTVGLGGVSPGPRRAAGVRGVDEKDSSEDKSSSLDSDEDLDTAIKDLLQSKRKPRRRHREPRAAGRRRVRFGAAAAAAETRAPGTQGAVQRGCKDRSPPPLKSCLSKGKRDSREDPARRPSAVLCGRAERTKPGSAGLAEAAPGLPPGRRAGQAHVLPGEGDTGHLRAPAASPSSRSEDGSSVDSDDSIELEIQKFLAEKAKESGSGPGSVLGAGSAPRPEPLCRKLAPPAPVLQPGVCTRGQRGRGTPQPQPAGGLRGGPRSEQASPPAALGRGPLAPPRSTGEAVSARGPPTGRRNLYPHREQSPRGAEPAAGNNTFPQPSGCMEAGPQAGSPGVPMPVPSQSRGALARSPGADRDGGAQAGPGLALPWGDFTHHSRLSSTWALSSEGRDVAWKGALASETGKGPEGAPGLAADPKKGLPFAGLSPLLSTQLFHFGNSGPWGAKPAGLFGPSPGLPLPLRGPSFSAFREAPAGRSAVFGSAPRLAKKQGGRWPGRTSGSDEDVLDLRYRRRVGGDDEDPEAWASDTSELSDTSVEDGSPAAKSRVLTL